MRNPLPLILLLSLSAFAQSDPLDILSKLELTPTERQITKPTNTTGFMCLLERKGPITLPKRIKPSVLVMYGEHLNQHFAVGMWLSGFTVTAADCAKTDWFIQTGRKDVDCKCIPH